MTKKYQKLSIISFSNNPDMDYYFNLKKEVFPTPIFLGPASNGNNLLDISCFSHKNGLSIRLLFDVFWAILQSIRLRSKGITHVIFDNTHISSVVYGVFFKALRIKQIHTIHDQTVHPGKNSLVTELYYRYFCKYFSDEYIFFSKVKFEFDPQKPAHFMRLCGFEKNEPSTLKGKDVLFFGRMQPYKGIEYLATLSCYLELHHPDSKLIVMGQGHSPHLEALHQRANVVVSNRYFSKAELIRVASQCAVTALPYTSATQSGVMIESYSLGLPVVYFKVGSLHDYCPNETFGLAAELGDLETFNHNLSAYLQDTPNSKKRLLDVFNEEFGVAAFQKQFTKLVNQILATPK